MTTGTSEPSNDEKRTRDLHAGLSRNHCSRRTLSCSAVVDCVYMMHATDCTFVEPVNPTNWTSRDTVGSSPGITAQMDCEISAIDIAANANITDLNIGSLVMPI